MEKIIKKKIAFVVGEFPVVSETFIINQVADLEDRGFDVTIFSFRHGNMNNISCRFYEHQMKKKTFYLDMPANKFFRLLSAVKILIKILFIQPKLIIKVLDIKKYGANASSLKLVFWVYPFLGKKFDLIHCHFGPIANKFLIIKDILGVNPKIVTSFYGYDVSNIIQNKPLNYYDRLKKESSLFFVMSNNMKERLVKQGFDAIKVEVLPVSINISDFSFKTRNLKNEEIIKLCSVGRFVEKKGFEDLLRALAIVKSKSKKQFKCEIIGDGPLKEKLLKLTNELNIKELVDYKGYMKIEDVVRYFSNAHLFVQPSKTALNGDME